MTSSMTYRERREAKAERLREWAAKRETKADADLNRAHDLASVIPLGQPILAGHHSQGSDTRYRARIAATMDRGVENARKADEFARRADNIEAAAAHAIYSDDADAVERLTDRIAKLEAQREQVKADNAAFRKANREALKGLTAYQRDRAMPHRGYVLTNLSGNISRQRARLAQLRRL